jgi:hypothetical protein
MTSEAAGSKVPAQREFLLPWGGGFWFGIWSVPGGGPSAKQSTAGERLRGLWQLRIECC